MKLYIYISFLLLGFNFNALSQENYYYSNYSCDYSNYDCNYKPLKTAFKLDTQKNTFQMFFKINGEHTPVINYRIKKVESLDSSETLYYSIIDDNGDFNGSTIAIEFLKTGAKILLVNNDKYTFFKLLSIEEINQW